MLVQVLCLVQVKRERGEESTREYEVCGGECSTVLRGLASGLGMDWVAIVMVLCEMKIESNNTRDDAERSEEFS